MIFYRKLFKAQSYSYTPDAIRNTNNDVILPGCSLKVESLRDTMPHSVQVRPITLDVINKTPNTTTYNHTTIAGSTSVLSLDPITIVTTSFNSNTKLLCVNALPVNNIQSLLIWHALI